MRLATVVLDGLPGERETVHLYNASVMPCRDCGACAQGSACPIDDDVPGVLEKMFAADLLLIASPLHFASLAAPLISFYSRLQPLWQAEKRAPAAPAGALSGIGLVVTGGGEYANMFEPARAVTAAVCISLRIPFAGMATAKRTDTVSIGENNDALAEAAVLAGKMRALAREC